MGGAEKGVRHVRAASACGSRSRSPADVCALARFWALVADALTPQDARELAEDLGIEYDTAEHDAVERGALCSVPLSGKRR